MVSGLIRAELGVEPDDGGGQNMQDKFRLADPAVSTRVCPDSRHIDGMLDLCGQAVDGESGM